MKKLKYFMMTMFVSLLALTGCSKKNSLTPSEAVQKASENMQTVENYRMNISMDMGLSMGESLSFDMSIDGKAETDVKNGKTHTTMSMNVFGQSLTVENYTDSKSKEGKMITYSKSSDDEEEWIKSESNYSEAQYNYAEIFSKLEKSNKIKELGSDKDNYKYEITLSTDDLNGLAETLGTNTIGVDLKGDIKMIVSIDKKTGNYTGISIDMKSLMEEALKNSDSTSGVKITKAVFELTVSDYNKVGEITIPSEVLNSASTDVLTSDSFNESDYDKVLTCKLTHDNVADEVYIGFINDKVSKTYEKISYKFDTEEEAKNYYSQIEDDDDFDTISRVNNEISATLEVELDEDEKNYSYSDVKSGMELEGYTCS